MSARTTSAPQSAPLRQRLRYRFDNLMAAGPTAMVVGLAIISAIIVIIAALLVAVVGLRPADGGVGFTEAAWQALLRTMDPGTMGGDAGWPYRLVSLGVTLGGIFVVATLIGVMSTGIQNRLDELRKGKSVVLESGHTLILGWSPTIGRVVAELAEANANVRRPRIVVVADRDKGEMDDQMRAILPPSTNLRVICRSGSPLDPDEVAIGNPATSRTIIILTPDEHDADAQVVKTLLAVVNAPDRRPEPYSIVAELRDPDSLAVAKMVGGDEVVLIPSSSMIAHITAQTCRQSGLSAVYIELLDFAGDEIYFADLPELSGRTFRDALLAFETSTLIGLVRNGKVMVAPEMDTVIEPRDRVIAIAEDDDKVILDGAGDQAIQLDRISQKPASPPEPEQMLITNWNLRAPAVIRDLNRSVPPGSEAIVLATNPSVGAAVESLSAEMHNLRLRFVQGDPTDRSTLELGVGSDRLHHMIILSSDDLNDRDADTAALLTLVHVRDIVKRRDLQDLTVVTELFDRRNRELARVKEGDDFIVSEEVISLLMAQVAENPALAEVLGDIFEVGGAQVSMRPAGDFVRLGVEVSYATVVHAARLQNSIALGYRRAADATSPEADYGVTVNPHKSTSRIYEPDDRIIILSHDVEAGQH